MIISQKTLPTGNIQYVFKNQAGVCFSAGKGQVAFKNESIPIFNKDFTDEEYELNTDPYLQEPNGVTITKDIVSLVTTRELTQSEINKIEQGLIVIKNNVNLFKD